MINVSSLTVSDTQVKVLNDTFTKPLHSKTTISEKTNTPPHAMGLLHPGEPEEQDSSNSVTPAQPHP